MGSAPTPFSRTREEAQAPQVLSPLPHHLSPPHSNVTTSSAFLRSLLWQSA